MTRERARARAVQGLIAALVILAYAMVLTRGEVLDRMLS